MFLEQKHNASEDNKFKVKLPFTILEAVFRR